LSNLPPLNPGTHRVTLCHGDEDWFFLATVPGDGVLAQATLLDPVVGAAVWELFDQDGMMLAESRRDGRTLTLGYGRAEDTTAFLRLASLDGFLQRVELYVEFVPGGFCTPDRWEPNDFRQEAVAVTPTSVGQGDGPAFTLCPGDEDWFKGSVLPGKTLTVTLLTEDGAGPAVALYGGVNPVLRSLDTALDATKVLTVTDPINFFVHVYRQDPTVGEHAALLFHVNN
jgi:hypothetical protein